MGMDRIVDHDDHEGQRVSRRSLLAGIGSVGLGSLLVACDAGRGVDAGSGRTAPVTTSTGETVRPRATTTADLNDLFAGANQCTLTPATTPGPFYFDADKIRSDVRDDREGTRLRVAFKVQDTQACEPLPNAVVEIWQADAAGAYSGAEPASGRFLRGAQVTNADGIVEFTTIWPGSYGGRTVHIHAMVHLSNERVLTTQVMFDDALNDVVLARRPYSSGRRTLNSDDSIFREQMLLKVTEEGDGYLGVIVFGLPG
jgi:protocatechuate 3,4-dioxygenase beta subunit